MNDKDLKNLKAKILASTVLSDAEKSEWLFLVSKMSDQQLKDLERLVSIQIEKKILGVKIPARKPMAVKLRSTFQSIKPIRPVQKEVVKEPEPKKPKVEQRPVQPEPKIEPKKAEVKPAPMPPPKPPVHEKHEQVVPQKPFQVYQGPSSVALVDLKKSASVQAFLQKLKRDLESEVASGKRSWREAILAYEKSPLYRAYLKSGVALMSGEKSAELTHDEFEELADFHTELKKLN